MDDATTYGGSTSAPDGWTPPPDPNAPPAPGGYGSEQSIQALQAKQQALLQQKKAALDPQNARALSTIGSPPPAPPQYQKMPEAPQANTEQDAKNAMGFLAGMALLGAIAPKSVRATGNAALNAFAGALQGYQKGQLEVYQQNQKTWEDNVKRTLENNKILQDQYRAVLENRKMTVDEMMTANKIIASKYEDQMMLNSQDITMQAKIMDKREAAAAKIDAAAQKLIQNHQLGMSGLYDPTVKQMVERRLAGEPQASVLAGSYRTPGLVDAFNAALSTAMETRGITGEDLAKKSQQYTGGTSFQRTAGSMSARVENATNEVEQLIPQALETSKALPRGSWVPLNKLMQQFEAGTSDPKYYDFSLANFSLMNAYARAMNPQGVPRVTERLEAHAAGVLSTATDEKSYEVQVSRLWKEVQASKKAVAETREGVGGVAEGGTTANPTEPKRPDQMPQGPQGAVGGGKTIDMGGGWTAEPH